MLRHKRMVHLSLYNFRRFIYFCDGTNFHTSDCVSLRRNTTSRKVYPEIRSEEKYVAGHFEGNSVAGNFETQPVTKTFNNFYGIESEEGVIHISAENNSIKSSQDSFIHKFTSKQMSEKFKNTCFGKVRLDSENKVIIHGQYEETSSISEISEIDKATPLQKFAISDPISNTSPFVEQTSLSTVESNNIKSKIDASLQLNRVKSPSDSQQKILQFDVAKEHNHGTANDISFIDESFFPEKLLKQEHNIMTNLSISNETCSTDEFDSKKVNVDKDVKFSISYANLDAGNVKCSDSSQLENHLPLEEKASFFDELMFGSKLENKNVEAKEKSIYGMTPEPTKTASFSNNNEKLGFIDDYYFNDGLKNEPTKTDSKCTIEDISSSEKTSIDNVAENARSHGIEKEKIIRLSKTEFEVKNLESNKDKFSRNGLKTQILNKMANEPELNSDNTNKFSYHEAVNEQPNTMSTPRSMSNSSFTEGVPSDRNDTVLHKSTSHDTKVPEDNEILTRKVAYDQKQSKDEQPETAFEFVKKLRGEKAPTYHEKISGFLQAPREKLDSKGFRILKYQVPELKYFTQDEMLELLVKNVLYSDDDVIILNKPYNLVMHESKTTKDACLSKYLDALAGELDKKSKKPKLLTVHRLDKETTGCLLLARNDTSAQYLKSLFSNRKIVKKYWIVTIKVPDPLQGIIDIPIAEGLVDNRTRMVLNPDLPKDIPYRSHSKRGRNAVTHYSVISESGNAALVEVKPETGLKHQIRVHFGLGLGCPILGDHKYTYADKLVPQKLQTDLLQKLSIRQSKVRYVPMHIYARSIFIPEYREGRNLFVMAPMPIHMSKNLQRLKFKKK